MTFRNPPYVFAIENRDITRVLGQHAKIAQRLTDAGFDVGLMLWTATPTTYTHEEIQQFWREAFERAGIARMEWGEDKEKDRLWFKVWKKETA
jgi:hypothetical protein